MRGRTDEAFVYGFQRKFLAQINLIRLRTPYVLGDASFTLSSGFLSDSPNFARAPTGPLELKARESKTAPTSRPSDQHQNDEVRTMTEKRPSLSCKGYFIPGSLLLRGENLDKLGDMPQI